MTLQEDLDLYGLTLDELTLARVKARFVELALRHHPDYGGDPLAFARVRYARDRLYRAAAKCLECGGSGTITDGVGFTIAPRSCPQCT